jgi:hypothetical protein
LPIPILPKAYNITTAQYLFNQDFSHYALDQIFNQNGLDYPQKPKALFVSDKFDLIAIAVSNDDNFQI